MHIDSYRAAARGWRAFRDDRDGVILVLGLVLCPALAAGAWYLLVVQTQIMDRERVQTAADAIADGGAAWYAAGMNILALMNVVMSVIMLAFIAIRVVELGALSLSLFFLGIAFIPGQQWAVGASTQLGRVAERAFQTERNQAPRIFRMLGWMTEAERYVARAFPYVSMGMSATLIDYVAEPRGIGVAANLGLTPVSLDSAAASIPRPGATATLVDNSFPPRMGRFDPAAGGGAPPAGLAQRLTRLAGAAGRNIAGSLPVEGEGFTQLCSRAAGDWATLPVVRDLPFADWLGQALGLLGGNFTTVLCQPLSQTADQLSAQIDAQVKESVNAKAESEVTPQCQADLAAGRLDTRGRAGRSNEQKLRNCVRGRAANWKGSQARRDFERTTRQEHTDRLNKLGQQQVDTSKIETAKLWSLISDGGGTLEAGAQFSDMDPNLFLDTFSIYGAAPPRPSAPNHQRSLEVLAYLAPGEYRSKVEGFQIDWSTARARIYFDCGARDIIQRSNDEHGIHLCADNALWRPGGWRHRMRTDVNIVDDLAATGAQALGGYIGWMTGELTQGLLGQFFEGRAARAIAGQPGNPQGVVQVWASRFAGTFSEAAGNSTGNSHVLDWWVGNTVGGAVTSGAQLEAPEFKWYIR